MAGPPIFLRSTSAGTAPWIEIALAISPAYGSFYTGIVASIYLPAAFMVRTRAADRGRPARQGDRGIGRLKEKRNRLQRLRDLRPRLLARSGPGE